MSVLKYIIILLIFFVGSIFGSKQFSHEDDFIVSFIKTMQDDFNNHSLIIHGQKGENEEIVPQFHSDSLPAQNEIPHEVVSEINNKLNKYLKDGYINDVFGSTSNVQDRQVAVYIQSLLENTGAKLLKSKKIDNIISIIHTPTVSTPLKIHRNLYHEDDEDILNNQWKLDNQFTRNTVLIRRHTIEQMLDAGVTVISTTSEADFNLLPIIAAKGINELIDKYSDSKLIICKLPDKYKQDLIDMAGATYILERDNQRYIYMIFGTQISDQDSTKNWAIMFFNYQISNKNSDMNVRLKSVVNLLQKIHINDALMNNFIEDLHHFYAD